MSWFSKNKKDKKNKKQTKALNETKPEVVSQQSSQFDVDPAFFDYGKIKTNKFLTDDSEYEKKKLIEDSPNGSANYLNVDKNKVEINARMQKDEAAFREIRNSLNNSYNMAESEFNSTKRIVNQNISDLSNRTTTPINSRVIDEKFYSKVAKGLDEQYKNISKDTKKFLSEMHTKVLDINNLNEPLVNTNENFEMGGTQTTKEWVSTDSGVNRYENLVKASKGLFQKTKDYQPTEDDFANLNKETMIQSNKTITVNKNNTEELIQKHEANINMYQNATSNKSLFTKSIKNDVNAHRATINLGLEERPNKTRHLIEEQNSASYYNVTPQKTNALSSNIANAYDVIDDIKRTINIATKTTSMKNNDIYIDKPFENQKLPQYDEIVIDHMTREINEHMEKRKDITSELREAARSKNHIYGEAARDQVIVANTGIDIETLIPINEVKMDLRTRKSQKRIFNFNPRGCF